MLHWVNRITADNKGGKITCWVLVWNKVEFQEACCTTAMNFPGVWCTVHRTFKVNIMLFSNLCIFKFLDFILFLSFRSFEPLKFHKENKYYAWKVLQLLFIVVLFKYSKKVILLYVLQIALIHVLKIIMYCIRFVSLHCTSEKNI